MTINAWPFLISRNQKLDYRVIAAPDFVIHANAVGLLNRELGGEESHDIQHKTLKAKNLGTLTAIFRTQPATKNGNVLVDANHRPISRIEGIVLKGTISITDVNYEGLLTVASKKIGEEFERFWGTTQPAEAVAMSGLPASEGGQNIVSSFDKNSGSQETIYQLEKIIARQHQSEKVIAQLKNQHYSMKKQLVTIKLIFGVILIIFLLSTFLGGNDNKKTRGADTQRTSSNAQSKPILKKTPPRIPKRATEKTSNGFFSWLP